MHHFAPASVLVHASVAASTCCHLHPGLLTLRRPLLMIPVVKCITITGVKLGFCTAVNHIKGNVQCHFMGIDGRIGE